MRRWVARMGRAHSLERLRELKGGNETPKSQTVSQGSCMGTKALEWTCVLSLGHFFTAF